MDVLATYWQRLTRIVGWADARISGGRGEGSSRAILATARPSCSNFMQYTASAFIEEFKPCKFAVHSKTLRFNSSQLVVKGNCQQIELENCPRIDVPPTASRTETLTLTLTFKPMRAIAMIIQMQKVNVKDDSVQKLDWKRTDRRTDGRTEAIALSPVLTQSIIAYLEVSIAMAVMIMKLGGETPHPHREESLGKNGLEELAPQTHCAADALADVATAANVGGW